MKPRISIIAAMDENRLIGRENTLPWHLPADLAFFKKTTMGKPILMGRKTFESIGYALPGRQNIVITGNRDFQAENCDIAHSIDEAIELAGTAEEVMLIGGARLYEQCLPLAEKLYLTRIHDSFEGDAWFPEFDPDEWREISREEHETDAKNNHCYSFLTLARI